MRMPLVDEFNRYLNGHAQQSMIRTIEAKENLAREYRSVCESVMADLEMSDAKDLRKMLALGKLGKWAELAVLIRRVDTNVRESIPDPFWEVYQENYADRSLGRAS